MKISLSFLCGVVVMLGFNVLHGANPSHHVYELRLYHVHEGKMDALKRALAITRTQSSGDTT